MTQFAAIMPKAAKLYFFILLSTMQSKYEDVDGITKNAGAENPN